MSDLPPTVGRVGDIDGSSLDDILRLRPLLSASQIRVVRVGIHQVPSTCSSRSEAPCVHFFFIFVIPLSRISSP